MSDLFRPLDIFSGTDEELATSLVREVENRNPFDLVRPTHLKGTPGVYLLYYRGDFEEYQPIVSPQYKTPIYVGKTKDLDVRLGSHCRTLDQVYNLDRCDFKAKVLPLPDIWIELVEKVMMVTYQPWWNQSHFAGFGNDGSPRASGKASRWEMMHPGRRRSRKKARPPEAEKLLQQACERAAVLAGQEEGFLAFLQEEEEPDNWFLSQFLL